MTYQEVRDLIKADPFRPFTIHYRTGDAYRILKRDDAWAPPVPGNTKIYVNDQKGSFTILDVTWIERISLNGRGGGTTRRRKAG